MMSIIQCVALHDRTLSRVGNVGVRNFMGH